MDNKNGIGQKTTNMASIGLLFANAEAGDVSAQFDLAQAYENGNGIAKDISMSIRWYQIAANNQHPGAHYHIGVALQRGISMQQNSVSAIEYFQKGAELGDVRCQIALADAYRDGRGITKDETKAVHWYTRASDQGNANAQYRLGKMYRYGTGVPSDIIVAIIFFSLAAEQGHVESAAALEKAKQFAQKIPKSNTVNSEPELILTETVQPERSIPLILIDSSVLLKDPDVVRRVIGNKGLPCITNTILSELDYNKKNSIHEVANNARLLLRELGKVDPVVIQYLPEGGSPINGDRIQQFSYLGNALLVFARERHRGNHDNDAKIIDVAKDYRMIIITADSGLKVRAQALGVQGFVWTSSERRENDLNKSKTKTQSRPSIMPFAICKDPVIEKSIILKVPGIPKDGALVYSGETGPVQLLKTLSAGGEGTIFETNLRGVVCKIYHKDKLTSDRKKKVELMLSRKIVKQGICWPIDVVNDSSGNFVGYLMPKAEGKPMQNTMFVKPVLEKSFPTWSRIDLVNLCIAFLDKIDFLHGLNIIVGDINPLNVLITDQSNNVWLVDTDSFQIEGFPCPVGTINFTAPEIQRVNYADFMRTREHELFAIATMLFMILHPGKPPYAQQGGGDPVENIKNQNFSYPYGKDISGKAPEGPWQNIWANLPGKIKEAFWNAFKRNQRIEVADWRKILKLYRTEILKGWHSSEIFPATFKIVDPIEVICGNCSEKVVASEKRYKHMISEGKSYFCGKCVSNIRLQILARKAREANHEVKKNFSQNSPQTKFKPNLQASHSSYYQPKTASSPQVSGGLFSAFFNIFK